VKIDARVDGREIQALLRDLKQIDNRVTRKLQRELSMGLGNVTAEIHAAIPDTPPIQGRDGRPSMSHRGRSRWRGANKPRVIFSSGSAGGWANLLVIEVTGGARGLGFNYAELAGIRPRSARSNQSRTYTRRGSSALMSHKVTTQGDEFIEALNRAKPIKGVAGRFAYDQFLKSRPRIIRVTASIIDRFMQEYNQKLDARMWGL
jgi:hypothetical protein